MRAQERELGTIFRQFKHLNIYYTLHTVGTEDAGLVSRSLHLHAALAC